METDCRKRNQGQCHGEEHLALVVKKGKRMEKEILEKENPSQRDNNVHSDFGRHPEKVEKTQEIRSNEC